MIPTHEFEKEDGTVIQECDYCAADCSVDEPDHKPNCMGVKLENLENSLTAERLAHDATAKALEQAISDLKFKDASWDLKEESKALADWRTLRGSDGT